MMSKRVTCFVLFVAASYPVIIASIIWLSGSGLESLSFTKSLLGGLFYLFLVQKIVKPYFFSPLRHLPEPPNVSFALGHGRYVSPPTGPTFLNWMRVVPNSGFIFARGFFHVPQILLLTTPETLMEVLNNKAYEYQKPAAARKLLSRTLGNGVLLAEGKQHKSQRKAVAGAFQGKHVKGLVPIFWAKAAQFTKKIAAELSGAHDDSKSRPGVIEIGAFTSRCTLDIIGKAGFNRDFNTLDNSDDELAKQYEIIVDPNKKNLALYLAVNVFLPRWLVRHIPWKMNQRISAAHLKVRRISSQMVADRKAKISEEDKGDESIDILSILMKSGDVSDETLVDECLTFLAAGHETTSSAIAWASYLLATHPKVQERLRTELVKGIPPAAFADPTLVDATVIDSLPLLHGVCHETLRLYPTVPITARKAVRDTTILGQPVPRGTEVMICPWAINHLESLWGPDADEFNPDRWIGDEKAAALGGATSHYAFLSFLHGPRSCIGQGFARLEMKCMLAALVLKFHVALEKPGHVPIPAGTVTIKPKGGLWLRLTEVAQP